MPVYSIRPLTSADLPRIAEIQQDYSAAHSGVPVIPGGVYLSPAFEGGQNVFCAVDEQGRVVGYAPVYPQFSEGGTEPHRIWTEVKADVTLPDPQSVKDALFARVVERATALARAHALVHPRPDHPAQLVFQYYPHETASIAYVTGKGCRHIGSIFDMVRDLHAALPELPAPEGSTVRRWRMPTEAEQVAYVTLHNLVLPGSAIALADWQYFMTSPNWAAGTAVAAFAGEELVGCLSAFPDIEGSRAGAVQAGFTEDIFVHPSWQGRGIGRRLIAEGLAFLAECGLDEARLQVSAANRGALRLYEEVGYCVARESGMYALELD